MRDTKWQQIVDYVEEELLMAFDGGRGMSKSELKALLESEFGQEGRTAEATAMALADNGDDWAAQHLGPAKARGIAYANWLFRTLKRLHYSALKRKKFIKKILAFFQYFF